MFTQNCNANSDADNGVEKYDALVGWCLSSRSRRLTSELLWKAVKTS